LGCKPREREDYSQGSSLLQREAIRSMSKKRNPKQTNNADTEKWRNIYRILFPKVPDFEIPSPCKPHFSYSECGTNRATDHEVPYIDLAVVREITQGFRQYFKEQFAKRFVSEWQYPYSPDFDEIVQRQTDAIVAEYKEIRHAASLELLQGPECPSSSRKRRRESASSTPGFENTTPSRQKPYFEHQPQATGSESASNLYSQHVALPVESYHDMTASGMPGPSQSQLDSFIPNAPVTSRAPIDLEYVANEGGSYGRVQPQYSAARIAPYQGDGSDFDFESYENVVQDASLFEFLSVGEEGSEPVAAAGTAMATGGSAPIVPGKRAPGIGFQSGGPTAGGGVGLGQG